MGFLLSSMEILAACEGAVVRYMVVGINMYRLIFFKKFFIGGKYIR